MARQGSVVVTGGAGFVGGAVARLLQETGWPVVILDRRTPAWAGVGWLRAAVGDAAAWQAIAGSVGIRAVVHCAGLIVAPESLQRPARYLAANVAESLRMLDWLATLDPPVPVVFSSSAAVYGDAADLPIGEATPCRPTTPYGLSKYQIEQALPWLEEAYGMPWMALRYFNAAGATDGQPERHQPETHLIPRLLLAARRGEPVVLYGTDYATADGTAVRDYVHVGDLARAHLAAVEHLEAGGESGVVNLGSGRGHSVAEVVTAVEGLLQRRLARRLEPRRPGDPPALVADIRRAAALLHWRPRWSELERLVYDADRALKG